MLKIHKDADGWTPCGLYSSRSLKRAIAWEDVTCKNCLKQRPPFKIKDYPSKDNLKEINEELNNLPWTTESEEEDENGVSYPDEEVTQEQQPKTPYEKWEQWFTLSCDYSFSPSSYETWDGAIDTICTYLRNELCVAGDLGLGGADEILNKTKKKFKNEY